MALRKRTAGILTVALLASGIALAQPAPPPPGSPSPGSGPGAMPGGQPGKQPPGAYNPPPSARSSNREVPPPQWKVGGKLPTEFRNNQFVVDNLQGHNLPKPKRGTRWVGIGADYLLVDSKQSIVEVRHWREGAR